MSDHVNEWLNAYFDGELNGRQLQQVEDHLVECEACQAELESLRGLSAMLQEAPAAEFVSHERFVSQLNLLLPQRQVKAVSNNVTNAGWWMIPVGLLVAWIFVSAAAFMSNVVSAADNFGLLDNTTASFIASPSDNAEWTLRLGRIGVLKGENLQWAEATEGFTRTVIPQFIWQVSIALLYLTWLVVWWARQMPQRQGQPLEG